MFDLNSIGKKTDKRDTYAYTVIAVDKSSTGIVNALKTEREDGKETIFTAKRFAELRESGKIKVLTENTFQLTLDKTFDPNARWESLD